MISYLDRTFCISKNCQNKCNRKLTETIEKEGHGWWRAMTGEADGVNCPFSVSCFCDEHGEVIK